MYTVEIITGDCDHCGAKAVLVARLGFAQVAQVCQGCATQAEADLYRAEMGQDRPASPPRLPTLRGAMHS